MASLASLYPPPSERLPYPWFFQPLSYITLVVGLYLGAGSKIIVAAVASVLFALAALTPCFTTGDSTTDYSIAGIPLCHLMVYLDVGVLCARGVLGATPPRYVGRSKLLRPKQKLDDDDDDEKNDKNDKSDKNDKKDRKDNKNKKDGAGQAWADTKPGLDRAKWALRLWGTPRGIGWNWQVHSVPAHPRAGYSRSRFVAYSLGQTGWYMALMAALEYGFSFLLGAFPPPKPPGAAGPLRELVWNAVIGYYGLFGAWTGISGAYSACAAVSVLVGLCEPWENPPLMTTLADAWSVRQAWGYAYHQIIRRPLSQPGVILCRLLGVRRGSRLSNYIQLYSAFLLSCLYHIWLRFAVQRRESGEFAFYMLQPVFITVEELVRQFVWAPCRDTALGRRLAPYTAAVGIAWTAACFGLTMPLWFKDALETGLFDNEMPAVLWIMGRARRDGMAFGSALGFKYDGSEGPSGGKAKL